MKYVVIDTETTGLDHEVHELLSLGAMVMIDGVITETLEVKIRPRKIELADAKALEVNGYSEYRWRNALDPDLACNLIRAFFLQHRDGTIVGHNVKFDIGFLKSFCSEFGYDLYIPFGYVDTRDVCRATLPHFGAQSLSLDNICSFLGWKRRKAHTALSDCEDCIKILRCLCPPSPKFLLRLYTRKAINDLRGLWL